MLRLGLWGARADRRGLAIQGAEFARHMRPLKVMGFDVQGLRGDAQHLDWDDYRDSDLTISKYPKITKRMAQEWMEGLDVVWGCETFYQDDFPAWAHEIGVATIQHCNAEFYRFDNEPSMPRPTLELVPAAWRLSHMSGKPTVLECPVATDRLKHRQRGLREQVTFLHVVGVKAADDRNGTQCILDALRLVREPCRVLIRAQVADEETGTHTVGNVTLEIRNGNIPHYWDLYDDGDVLLMPRRYGGQCLPVLEAAACGLPSIMTAVSPQTGWDVPMQLIDVADTTTSLKTQAGGVTVYHPDAVSLARAMDSMTRSRVRAMSSQCKEWRSRHSWTAKRPDYLDTLERAAAIMRA